MTRYLLSIAVFGLMVTTSPALGLSPVSVQRLAKKTTVRIRGCDRGSGVIIQQKGNNYLVLTAAHVVKSNNCQVVTPDDAVYPVVKTQFFPHDIDLAVVQFTSRSTYSLAKLAKNSDLVEAGENVFVSGFPVTDTIPEPVFVFIKGDVVSNSTLSQGKGYSLIYTNPTLPGHSGGPVWNNQGEVIAIHGRGDVESRANRTQSSQIRIKTGFNLGIPVNTFLKNASAVGLDGYRATVVTGRVTSVDDLIASAIHNESRQNYAGVLADMNRAIAMTSRNPRLYFLRGAALYNLGDKKGALADYNQAIAINPSYSDAYVDRGLVKSDLGDQAGELADYNRAIATNPQQAIAYNNRGYIKFERGDRAGARADYQRALALYRQQGKLDSPDYQRTLNNLRKLNE